MSHGAANSTGRRLFACRPTRPCATITRYRLVTLCSTTRTARKWWERPLSLADSTSRWFLAITLRGFERTRIHLRRIFSRCGCTASGKRDFSRAFATDGSGSRRCSETNCSLSKFRYHRWTNSGELRRDYASNCRYWRKRAALEAQLAAAESLPAAHLRAVFDTTE